MAAETQQLASETPAPATEEVIVTPAEVEKSAVKETGPPPPVVEEAKKEEEQKPKEEVTPEVVAAVEEEKKGEAAAIAQSVSFKEESNKVADLIDPEKKALDELKQLVAAALANNEFTKLQSPPPKEEAEKKAAEEPEKKEAEEPEKKAEEPTKAGEASEPCEEAPKAAEKAPKAEEPVKETETPKKEEPAAAKEETTTVVVAEETKAVVVDEDGAKTVEAIEETVVTEAATVAEASDARPPAETTKDAAAAVAAEKTEEQQPTASPPSEPEKVVIWGVPLLDGSEKSDTILLKFLRARDFKPKDAVAMLKDTVIWRKEFGIEDLLSEDLELPELGKAVFMHGVDKEGHPVCYNTYGEFQDKELYAKAFGDEEKRKRFLRWRVQFLEKGIREFLDFSPEGICTMVQVNDLKNSPWLQKKELRQATKQAVHVLQDNYPEFVAKQVFINVPWWYLALNRMMSPFLTHRTKSKFVFAGPSKSAETLFKYIAPEQVPVEYGGLSKENDHDFSTSDAVTEVTIKPSSKQTIEIPVSETCLLVWELRVLGWDVSYGAEFVPDAEGGYTVVVQKSRKFTSADEPIEKNSFKIGEPGKIVLTIDNATSKKKKLLYRSKTKSSTDSSI